MFPLVDWWPRRPPPAVVFAASAVCILAVETAVAGSAAGSAGGPASRLDVERWQDGARLQAAIVQLESGRAEEALRDLLDILNERPDDPAVHFWAGMAAGQLQDFAGAYDHFVRAAELQPGFGEAHMRACMAAYWDGEYEASWEQAILAAQAGVDMQQAFAELRQKAPPPDDLESRLRAPRIMVGNLDARGALGRGGPLVERRGERPPEVTPDAVRADIDRDPFATETRVPSDQGMLLPPEGAVLGAHVRTELVEVRRQLAAELRRARAVGLVPRPEIADYILHLQVDEIAADEPRTLRGRLLLLEYDSAAEVWSRPVQLRDVGSIAAVRADMVRWVEQLEAWLAASHR